MWTIYKKGFKAWLQLEKSLSKNSVLAYMADIERLTQYLSISNETLKPGEVNLKLLESFLQWINELGMTPSSQSSIISGLRSFFQYCLLEQIISTDPTALLETPKLGKKLPDVLSVVEIEKIIQAIDLSTMEGTRNKAIIGRRVCTCNRKRR